MTSAFRTFFPPDTHNDVSLPAAVLQKNLRIICSDDFPNLSHYLPTFRLFYCLLHFIYIIVHLSFSVFCFLLFWLCRVFVATSGLSLVVASGLRCGARASHCGGFSCCGARALGTQASVVVARGL